MLTALAIAASTIAQPVVPVAAMEAVCKAYQADQDKAGFWAKVDAELKLDDRQRVEVRMFCVGFQRGQLDRINAATKR